MNANSSPIDTGKEIAKTVLEAAGFKVDSIPESNGKTPDLAVPCEDCRVLIEVKLKIEDEAFRNILNSETGSAHVYDPKSSRSRLREGRKQLQQYADRLPDDFAVVWITALNTGTTALVGSSLLETVYGIAYLDGHFDNGKYFEGPCYFFRNAWFHRYRDVDAVVIYDCKKQRLCLNSLSPRHTEFVNHLRAKMPRGFGGY